MFLAGPCAVQMNLGLGVISHKYFACTVKALHIFKLNNDLSETQGSDSGNYKRKFANSKEHYKARESVQESLGP